MRRIYPVRVMEHSDGKMFVLVVGSDNIMVGWANEPGFTGQRMGDTVGFDLTDHLDADYAMIERIAVGDIGYSGTAKGTIDTNGKIVAVFNGEYTVAYGTQPPLCQAPDHHMEFVPTGR